MVMIQYMSALMKGQRISEQSVVSRKQMRNRRIQRLKWSLNHCIIAEPGVTMLRGNGNTLSNRQD